MKIIIDIPEDVYYDVLQYAELKANTEFENLMICAIKHGTPLPNGHGRLIDAEELKKNNEEYIIQDPTDSEENTRNIIVGWINEDIANAPTIIEADKAESEGNDG